MCIQPKSFFFLLFFFFVLQGPYQRYFVLSMAYYIRQLGPLKAPKKKNTNTKSSNFFQSSWF